MIYFNPDYAQYPSAQLRGIADDTMPSGLTKVDIVSLFCGHYCTNDWPCLRSAWHVKKTSKVFDTPIEKVLTDGSVKYLQEKGIVVLLTIMNGDTKLGWSRFSSSDVAQKFVNYLKSEVVHKYDLDGIDIDDEWDMGNPVVDPVNNSLAMVTELYKASMPEKLITKALFMDKDYFQTNWKGSTLSKNLNYGWEMTYWMPVMGRVEPYSKDGMKKRSVLCGFSAAPNLRDKNVGSDLKMLLNAGYGGAMLWAYVQMIGEKFDSKSGLDLEKAIFEAILHFEHDDQKEDSAELLSIRENISADSPVAKKDIDRGVDVHDVDSRAERDQEDDTTMKGAKCCAIL